MAWTALQGRIVELFGSDKNAAEELVLESYPLQRLLHGFAIFAAFRQIVCIVVLLLVCKGRELLLKVETLLLLSGNILPVNGHALGTGVQYRTHSCGLHAYLHQIAVCHQMVVDVEVRCLVAQTHGNGAVRTVDGLEGVVAGVDVVILAHQLIAKAVHSLAQELYVLFLLVLVLGKACTLDAATLSVQCDVNKTIANGNFLALSIACFKEKGGAVLCLHGQFQSLLLFCLFYSLCLLGLLNAVLSGGLLHLCNFLGRRLAVPAESNQHKCNEHKAHNSVFIHNFIFEFRIKRVQSYD